MKKRIQSPLFIAAICLLVALAVLQVALPARERSDLENRPLAQMEAPTVSSILSGHWMQQTETAVADQFAGRDLWMDLQALWDTAMLRSVRGGMLQGKDGWLFEPTQNLDLRTSLQSVQALETLAETLDIPVTLMLVPMSSAVYEEYLPWLYEPDDQGAILDTLYAEAHALETVDLLDRLRREEQKLEGTERTLFYRTDHHWTADGAQVGYYALAKQWKLVDAYAMGQKATLVRLYVDGFYGTYFSRAPSPLLAPDTLTYDDIDGITLSIDGEEMPSIYDPEQMAMRDKYASLLWGNHGRSTLMGGTGNEVLLVIKDSYANALLPLLAQHFGRVEMVDLRYYPGDLMALLEETEADRVLCLYGLTTFLTDRNLLLQSAAWDG